MGTEQPSRPRVVFAATARFERRIKKLMAEEQRALAQALRRFQANPNDPRLHTHKLTGPFEGK